MCGRRCGYFLAYGFLLFVTRRGVCLMAGGQIRGRDSLQDGIPKHDERMAIIIDVYDLFRGEVNTSETAKTLKIKGFV
jgi:hypothetical protein